MLLLFGVSELLGISAAVQVTSELHHTYKRETYIHTVWYASCRAAVLPLVQLDTQLNLTRVTGTLERRHA